MVGFRVNTIRSTDKPSRKAQQLHQFNNPNSSSQIFLANINIMANGVNLHTCCSRGIVINFHYNAKVIQQVHGRLNRIGQANQVVWHMLKVKNSFHDHQERAMITKMALQISAEANLRSWMTGSLREIVVFEMAKSYFNHRFNRLAWAVLRDVDGLDMEYHSDQSAKIGHAFSCIAKLLVERDDGAYWKAHEEQLYIATINMVDTMELHELEDYVWNWEQERSRAFRDMLARHLSDTSERMARDPDMAALQIKYAAGRERREKQTKFPLSEEFVLDSDAETDIEDEDEQEEDLPDDASDADGGAPPSVANLSIHPDEDDDQRGGDEDETGPVDTEMTDA